MIPHLTYYTEEQFSQTWDPKSDFRLLRTKREPITAVTLAVLLGLGTTGAGVGITSLILSNKYYSELRLSIDEDIERLESAISHLQNSLSSLAEVVLQNRRGLDLLLLQQGSLCAALKEECCFYIDHSGVVKDSMAKVREGLEKRRKQREQEQSWFQNWFSTSPWLTTLTLHIRSLHRLVTPPVLWTLGIQEAN